MRENSNHDNDNVISFPENENSIEQRRKARRAENEKKSAAAKKMISLAVLALLLLGMLIFILNDTTFEATNQVNLNTIALSGASNYDYASYLGGYIIAKDGKISCYNTLQKLQWEFKGSKTQPTVKTNGQYCLVYYNDDRLAVVTNGKNTNHIKTDGNVTYGYVNKNGYCVLFTLESGLKNKISVFNKKGEEIYFRQNADTHIPWAILSDDNTTLLTIELNPSKNRIPSTVHLFDINESNKEISSFPIKDSTIAGCFFYNKTNFVVVQDDKMESYTVKGKKNWSVDYNKKTLSKFSYNNDGIICLLFNKDASAGSSSEVDFYKTSGGKISAYTSDKHIYDADMCEKTAVLRLDRQFLTVNSKSKLISSTDVSYDIKDSVVMGNKKCVFVLTTSEDAVLVEF